MTIYFAGLERNGMAIDVDTRNAPKGQVRWQGGSRSLSSTEIERWLAD